MEKWYRAMVVFMALAAALCTSAAIYAGARLAKVRLNGWTARENEFVWDGGAYRVQGNVAEGVLEHLLIDRMHEIQDLKSD